MLKPHLKEQWVIPPEASSAFVAAMEDVLEVYQRPRDPARPLVCLDETSKQLIAETRAPIPMQKGRKARFDYEYERNGTANLFMMFAPLEGWRNVKVTTPPSIMPACSRSWPISISPRPRQSSWCKTISTPLLKLRSTRPSLPSKPEGSLNDSNSTTHRNMEAGSTWPSLSWASSPYNVSIAGFPTRKNSAQKSLLGRPIATNITPRQIGNSRPKTLASNSSAYILNLNDSGDQRDLAWWESGRARA